MIYPRTRPTTDFSLLPGDIFSCFGTDRSSRFISLQTSWHSWIAGPARLRWSPSHVAIACPRYAPHNQQQYWVESCSTGHRPCLERRKAVSGCQVHHPSDRIRDYTQAGGRVDLYRLTPINRLTGHSESQMRQDLIGWFVKNEVGYDSAAAIFSGTRVVKVLEKLVQFWPSDPHAVFCSQLLAAELQSLCRMNKDNPIHYNPGRLMRLLVYQGTYSYHTTFTSPNDSRLELL